MAVSVRWLCRSHGRLNWFAPFKLRFDDTGKTVRPREDNVNLRDLADQGRRAFAVDSLQIGRTAGNLPWFPPGALEEDADAAPDGGRIEGAGLCFDESLEPGEALLRNRVRDLIGKLGCGRARPGAIFERKGAREADGLHERD